MYLKKHTHNETNKRWLIKHISGREISTWQLKLQTTVTDDPGLIGANLNTTATSLREGSGQVGGLVLTEEGDWIGEAALIGGAMRKGEKAN